MSSEQQLDRIAAELKRIRRALDTLVLVEAAKIDDNRAEPAAYKLLKIAQTEIAKNEPKAKASMRAFEAIVATRREDKNESDPEYK